MKKYKTVVCQLIVCLLIAATLLTGCRPSDGSASGTLGNSVEISENGIIYEEVLLSDKLGMKDIASLDMNSRKEIVAYCEEQKKFVFLGDGDTIVREFETDQESRICFDIDGSDNIHILFQEITRGAGNEITAIKRTLELYDSQGNKLDGEAPVKDVNKGTGNLSDEVIMKLLVDGKGNIYALKLDRSVEIFGAKLESIGTLEKERYLDIALDENDRLIVTYWSQGRENTIEAVDWKNGKTLWKKEYASLDAPRQLYYNSTTTKLYGLNEKSVISYGKTGEEKKVLLDYTGISVVEQPESFVVNDKEEIYLAAINQDTLKLIKYVKSDKKASDSEVPQKELVFEIFLDMDNAVSNAAREFEKTHPDVKIKVVDTRDVPYDEYEKKMSTELLTGKGPDIYCGFSGAVSDYIDKGLLADFDGLIKEDKEFDIKAYNASILNGSRYKGGLYTIPLTYSFDCVLVNDKLLKENNIVVGDDWTWKDLYDITKQIQSSKPVTKYYALPKMLNPWIPLDSMVFGDIDYYVDRENKTAKFNTPEFKDLLKLHQSFQKDGMIHPETEDFSIISSRGKVNADNFIFLPIDLYDYYQISIYGKCFNDSFRILPMPKGMHSDTRYFTGKNVFINNSSKHKKEAWGFVKYLLSEEVQSRLSTQGQLILHKGSEDKKIKEIFEYQSKHIDKEDHKITEADIAQVKHMTTGVLNRSRTYGELYSIIWQELDSFMKNESGVEDTAKTLQNKVELYLRE